MRAGRWSTLPILLLLVLAGPLVTRRATLHAQGGGQGTGRVIGRVVDAAQGAPLAGAQVEIVDNATATVVTTALDGRYTLQDVPSGTITIRARMIGYQPKQVTGIVVESGKVAAQDIALASEVVQLQEITVAAAAERGSVNRALEEQRDAPNIVNAVTAEQISRSPDGDAGQAVQRVSGVTVQDGKFVFVRGLGERYTTASLNGARIPSPEPERKVVPLDLFPSGLLEGITTSKTFTPDQPGDFSGASVNLKTREFPLGRVITLSTSAGMNTAAAGKTILKAPTVGGEWRGVAGEERQLPATLDGVATTFGRSEAEVRSMAASLRDQWSPLTGNGTGNGSLSLSIGGEDPLIGKQLIGYIASASYSYNQEIRADEERALVGESGSGLQPYNRVAGSTGRTSVLWGGMLNVSTRIGTGTKLGFNNSYTRSADNEAVQVRGFNEEFATPVELSRLTFTQRSVRSNQLQGEHLLGSRSLLEWSATNAGVRRSEPDRSDLKYALVVDPASGDTVAAEWFTGNFTATRTFSELDETSWDLGASYRYTLGSADNPTWLKLGGAWRAVDRDASSQPYDLRNVDLTTDERRQQAEAIFTDDNAHAGRYTLAVNQIGGSYTATDRVTGGYAMIDFPLTARVRILGGARVERWTLDLESFEVVTGRDSLVTKSNTDVLPSLGVNVILSETQNLRFAASQTLSRPEYREIYDGQSYDAISGLFLRGNPALQRALIQNFDLRWEWYPRAGEVLSLGVFAKRFQDPIERVYDIQTGAAAIGYINADKAMNYGLELEARKNLGFLAAGLLPFSAFVNATVMESEITPGSAVLTSDNRPMVGQAPYVVNTGLGYTSAGGAWSATALYNVVGRRISEAGFKPFPDTYEEARQLVDVSLQGPIAGSLSFRADAKNLLDAPIRFTQGGIQRLRYRAGRLFSLGLKWEL